MAPGAVPGQRHRAGWLHPHPETLVMRSSSAPWAGSGSEGTVVTKGVGAGRWNRGSRFQRACPAPSRRLSAASPSLRSLGKEQRDSAASHRQPGGRERHRGSGGLRDRLCWQAGVPPGVCLVGGFWSGLWGPHPSPKGQEGRAGLALGRPFPRSAAWIWGVTHKSRCPTSVTSSPR